MRRVCDLMAGCVLLEGDLFGDERGWFRRLHAADAQAGVPAAFRQTAVSYNRRRGTLRGLHFQAAPNLETKLVQCLRGAVFDVMVDLRPDSPGYGRAATAELTEENGRAVLAEPGFAHGFLTLADDSLVAYLISPDYAPQGAGGVRWDDADLAIPWPHAPVEISPRDRELPRLRDHDPRLTTPAAAAPALVS